MNVVLADIDGAGLQAVEDDLQARGAQVLSVAADVGRLAEVEALADSAYARFGAVHLVFNNAGVMTPGSLMKLPLDDMRRMVDTNLWGTLYGMKVFMPQNARRWRRARGEYEFPQRAAGLPGHGNLQRHQGGHRQHQRNRVP